jgi:uncharacterized repeat protein (TIGR01451 family)
MVCCALLFAVVHAADAQTFVSANTTTTLYSGSQDTTTFGFGPVTAPVPGIILTGTAISTITGKPIRHLWYGDPLNGFCRIDPEVDEVLPAVAGQGQHNPNIGSCLATVQVKGIVPGIPSFDAATNSLFIPDISRTNAGALRAIYLPSGDNGNGSIDLVHVTSLVGTQAGRNAFGGCPQLHDPKNGTPVPIVTSSSIFGPDGALYIGSIRNGAIVRVLHAATFDPNQGCPDPTKLNQPGDQVQIPILSADERFGAGHTFGMGWVNHSLFGADNIAPWIQTNADQCLTPINGNKMCASPAVGGQAPMPTEILAAQVSGPQGGLISDAVEPNFPGSVVYAATLSTVTRVSNILSGTQMTVNLNYGGPFATITGMAADPLDPANATVFVGDDPTGGGINGSGRIWQVVATPTNTPPATPTVLSATGGPGTGQVSVAWAPTVNGAAISSYTVEILLAPALPGGTPTPSGLANVTVPAPGTTTVISGLTSGTTYMFAVEACNTFGCSAFSSPSAAVTAFTIAPPPAPTNVIGVAVGDGVSAAVSWTQTGNGNSPITSSTLSAFNGGNAAGTKVVLGAATGGTITGLACGNSYQFSVAATNAAGTGAASQLSLPVAIPCVTSADVSLTMSSPATINPGSILTYNVTVQNGGPAPAAQILVSDTLPAPFVSVTSSQGICAGAIGVTSMSCNLGSLAAGASATYAVSVQLPALQTTGSFTNTATASVTNAQNQNVDPNLANNSASSTTSLQQQQAGCSGSSTTDIQVVGSSSNGNPVHGTPDTFTWQIRNNQGTQTAFCVAFTAATTAPTGQVLSVTSTNPGTCTINAAGTNVSCSLGNIPGGQAAIVTVTATPSAAAPSNSYSMTGSAQLGTGSTDSNPANNSFTVLIGAQ